MLQRGQGEDLADEVDGQVQLVETLTPLQVLHALDTVQRQVQILQLLQPAQVLCRSGHAGLVFGLISGTIRACDDGP